MFKICSNFLRLKQRSSSQSHGNHTTVCGFEAFLRSPHSRKRNAGNGPLCARARAAGHSGDHGKPPACPASPWRMADPTCSCSDSPEAPWTVPHGAWRTVSSLRRGPGGGVRPEGRGVRQTVDTTAALWDQRKAGDVRRGISIFLQTHRERSVSLSYLIKISSVSCSR